jgi:deoxyribodipyrimidine photolyase
MKIVVSIPFQRVEDAESFLEAVEHLRKLGHNVFETHDHTITKKTNPSKEYLTKHFDKVDKAVKDADILLAEVTDADSKVGYEIARALDEKKVVIALEHEDSTDKLHPSIHGNKSNSFIHKRYAHHNVVDVVTKAVKEAAGKLDSKFILIISPEIDRYLEWAGQTKRMHKAQIVRNAVEQMMKKDREYKTYIQG